MAVPYIEKSERRKYEAGIRETLRVLKSVPPERIDGELNYVITKILKELYEPRYFSYNRALGVLEAVKQEFYRRVVAPYEDRKLQETGDI